MYLSAPAISNVVLSQHGILERCVIETCKFIHCHNISRFLVYGFQAV